MKKIIAKITFNWFAAPDRDYWESADIKSPEVVSITEHRPAGEGDRLWYDILYLNGEMARVFNPNTVTFEDVSK